MTTSTLDRLAETAVAARGGADLYRFGLADRIPDSAFAKNSDGSITISGVDLLKSGTFNGFGILDEDLVAMAARFVDLRDAGIFVPPFRLDHSWSILSVVGYFENVETYVRVDETDSLRKTFLRGDIRLTGSIDYKPADLVDAIKRGALRSRSSELGYYVTNAGVELPLVFYGAAFVDIPAVEGLAPVTLSKNYRPEPHSIVNLTASPEGPAVDPETTETETPETTEEEVVETPTGGEEVETETPAEEEAEGEAESVEEAPEGDPAGETLAAESEDPEEGAEAETDPAGEPGDDEVSALRAEIARLRREGADREIARFREAGVIVEANAAAAQALLTHDDESVRRSAGTLLAAIPSPVTLGRRRGRTALSNDGGNGNGEGGSLIRIGMSKDEVGPLWANLTREERAAHRSEYEAWRKDRDENGIRD